MYCSLSSLLLASLLSSAIYKPLQTTILPSCISFSWEWFRLPPSVQCYEPPSIVLQALCLLDLIPWILLSYPLYNCKVIPEWPSGFPNLLQFKPEFFNKQVMIWAKVNSRSYFCQLYRAPPSSPAKDITNLILVLTIWGCPVLPCVAGQRCLLWLVSCYWPVYYDQFFIEQFNFSFFGITGWDIDLDCGDVEWLPWKWTKIILSFLRLHPSTAFQTLLITMEGHSMSSKGFLPTIVGIMVIWIEFARFCPV